MCNVGDPGGVIMLHPKNGYQILDTRMGILYVEISGAIWVI